MAATTTGRVLEYLRDNPKARNAEIARAAACSEDTVRTIVYRLRRRNDIEMGHSGGKHYFVDFIEAGSYSERPEIGRMICRVLENF